MGFAALYPCYGTGLVGWVERYYGAKDQAKIPVPEPRLLASAAMLKPAFATA
jgi:hypothetical protein